MLSAHSLKGMALVCRIPSRALSLSQKNTQKGGALYVAQQGDLE